LSTSQIQSVAIAASLFTILQLSAFAETAGSISTDIRLRHETAKVDGLEDADNTSIRARIGFFSKELNGLSLGVEGEFTAPFDKDNYNAAGVHGDTSKAVIADPENTQLDQAFIQYVLEGTTLKAGRQVITLDNHRFIGDVGWRQNRQTFDAVTIKNTSIENLTLFYGYVDNVVRIFGSEAPATGGNAEEADSESHLLNASYKISDTATLTLYAYLLELDDVPAALSTDSIGGSLNGKMPLSDELAINYLAEYASQTDAGDNPVDYTADYVHLTVGTILSGLGIDIGYELLGADQSGFDAEGAPVYGSFKTPLATLHKFNGFADKFLVTPATGLEDVYVTASYGIPLPTIGPVKLIVGYHDFSSDIGSKDEGDEIDAALIKGFTLEQVPGSFNTIAKYASFDKGDSGVDTDRFSIELNYVAKF
jgi:hypothetical protein